MGGGNVQQCLILAWCLSDAKKYLNVTTMLLEE
jgi:hypothetical protein